MPIQCAQLSLMASHKSLYFYLLSSLLFLFISPCHSSSNNNVAKVPYPVITDQKVNLNVYYDALCASSTDFIVNKLVNIFKTDLINIVNLRLVPWGNAQLGDKNITCQYGPVQCYLNNIHACAMYYWPDVKKHFSFIRCVESQTLKMQQIEDAKALWVNCSRILDFDKIKDCCDSNKIEKCEEDRENIREINELLPPREFVPWVTVNNKPLYRDYNNFVAYVCKAYKGKLAPMACRIFPPKTEKKIPNQPLCYPGEATIPGREILISDFEQLSAEPKPPA